ncbi:MAG: C40 family peptidase [Prochlorococcaceae cyanobacterium]|jgi:cell wall-associated NlpC family hydrolase
MARLGILPAGLPAAPELLQPGTLWRLLAPIDAYSRPRGMGLATQVAAGRVLRLREGGQPPAPGSAGGRLRVRLLEDGYPCWIEPTDLLGRAVASEVPRTPRLQRPQIEARLEAVLAAAEQARRQPNVYLWGGTLGPDYDCSGLIQTLFAAQGIWLPRDAYLQERFCRPVAVRPGSTALLHPGDLIFFGTARRCTHVALHLEGGRYLHSSGREHGRNGIGIDDLSPSNQDPVSCHYRAELRGAGRVLHCHDGSPCGD